jgi:hypothetical protein
MRLATFVLNWEAVSVSFAWPGRVCFASFGCVLCFAGSFLGGLWPTFALLLHMLGLSFDAFV